MGTDKGHSTSDVMSLIDDVLHVNASELYASAVDRLFAYGDGPTDAELDRDHVMKRDGFLHGDILVRTVRDRWMWKWPASLSDTHVATYMCPGIMEERTEWDYIDTPDEDVGNAISHEYWMGRHPRRVDEPVRIGYRRI